MNDKERVAMQQALEALEEMFHSNSTKVAIEKYNTAHTALREALDHFRGVTKMVVEQAEQEPLMITPGGGAFPIIEVDYVGEFAEPIRSSVVPLDWSATFTPVQQEPVSTDWTPPNYTDEQWQKLDQEYQDHVAEQALQKLADFHQMMEQEPECKYKEAYIIWQDKTEWVQETAQPKELGMHRADVLRQRIENLQNAAPVRTKDLTDDELEAVINAEDGKHIMRDATELELARAVIAADREKNK